MAARRPCALPALREAGMVAQQAAKYFTSTEACSCPDWLYRGHIRPCKHVRELRGGGLMRQ